MIQSVEVTCLFHLTNPIGCYTFKDIPLWQTNPVHMELLNAC